MYDLLFYTLLIITTLILIKSRVGKKWWRPRLLIGKITKSSGLILVGFVALLLWSMQILHLTAPRGSMLHEAVRLPEHYFHLGQQETPGLAIHRHQYGEHHRQYFLLVEPSVPTTKKKIIFYVHGGGWHVGKPESHLPLAKILSEEGYTVVMPAYRLGPWHGYDELTEDIHLALKRTLELQEEQQWCKHELVLGGTSAGGNLAALLLYDRERLAELGLAQNAITGFFSLAGALDIEEMSPTLVLQNYAGAPDSPSFTKANPVCYIQHNEQVPVLCIHGDRDGLVNYQAACSFVNELEQVNPDLIEMHSIEGATHLEIASQWYYQPEADYGQDEILLNWLRDL